MESNEETIISNDEIKKYGRQLILPEFGMQGQRLLKSSSALVVGCGGLGCPAAIHLAASGIGRLGLLDHDIVEISNLHRQILHKEATAGQNKCHSARLACQDINSMPRYVEHCVAIDSSNAMEIIQQYDVVLDCTDNVATRYLLNDACVLAHKPLVSGAALKFEGQLTVYNWKEGPCYRCLYPTPPPPHTVTSCSEGGVLGVVPGVIGTMQAQEAIKVLTQMNGSLSGRLFLYDALSFSTRVIRLRPRQPSCVVCGDTPTVKSLIDYIEFCGVPAHDKPTNSHSDSKGRITTREYKLKYIGTDHLLVDTRPQHELEICKLPNTYNVPFNVIAKAKPEELRALLPQKVKTIVCVCHHGNDSQIAMRKLCEVLSDRTVVDIIGGLEAWARKEDPNFPVY